MINLLKLTIKISIYNLLIMWFLSILIFSSCRNNDASAVNELIHLSNEKLAITVDPFGGAISELYLTDDSLNFLNWQAKKENMPPNNRKGAPFKGHFLCYGRWGAPTEGEIEAGIPHNGHHNNLMWNWEKLNEDNILMMDVASDLEQYGIRRKVDLDENLPLFRFSEEFLHSGNLGRLSNIVQHVTIGPPFLNPSTRFYSNCGPGFLQESSYPDPVSYEYKWPFAKDSTGKAIDLSHFQTQRNFVSTHIIEDEKGWIVAVDPVSGSFLGYIWNSIDYPWVNLWNHQENGMPVAYGMEFGTTGIGRPYDELLKKDTRFHNYSSFIFMDAGERAEKEFIGFAGRINGDFEEVEDITIDSFITVIFINSELNDRFPVKYDLKALNAK
ncbi:MAG: hypothetical protein ACOCUP_00690 [bacterium]